MKCDVVIVGGGIVGSLLALALAKQTDLSIVVLEKNTSQPQWQTSLFCHRVSAISLASQRIFKAIGVWRAMEERRVSPFLGIEVWESGSAARLHFDAKEIDESRLGYIIENDLIQRVLHEALIASPQIQYLQAMSLGGVEQTKETVVLKTTDGQSFAAKLGVAADGAASWLRQAVNVPWEVKDYRQQGVVATVTTDLPHQSMARQCFLKGGPLAFLPLTEAKTASIVWSVPEEQVSDLMALSDTDFSHRLSVAFDHRLGEVTSVGSRYAFPLKRQQAGRYIAPRIALVGDAAHTIHPLAGQGVNIGILDAVSLAEVIAEALKRSQDFSSYRVLRRYERWRRADNLAMQAGVDWIASLSTGRSLALRLAKQLPGLKNKMMREAVGNRLGLPLLAKTYTAMAP